MIVEDGVFHADPHPGNLAVQADGTLVFYDFGMTGELGARTREHLLDFYVGIATDDIDQMIDAFIAMDALDPTANRDMVRQLFELAFDQFRGADLEEFDVEGIINEFEGAMHEFPMRIPQDLAHVVRVTTVLDGVTCNLAPEFDFIQVVTEYVLEREIDSEDGALRDRVTGEITDQVRDSVSATVGIPSRLDAALDRVDRGELTLSTVVEDDRRAFARMGRRLIGGVVFSAGIPLTAYLYTVGNLVATAASGAGTAMVGLILLWSFRRKRGTALGAKPQFTRQEMRRQRDRENRQ